MVEQSHDAVLVVQDRKLVFVNPKMEDVTGYSRKELLGMGFEELIHPDYIGMVEKYYKERIKGGDPPNRYQLKMIDKTGDEHILELSVSQIKYNQEPATMANLRDITQQKQYEQNVTIQ